MNLFRPVLTCIFWLCFWPGALAWDYASAQNGDKFELTASSGNFYFVSWDCHGCYEGLKSLRLCPVQKLKHLKVISLSDPEKSKKLWGKAGADLQKFILNPDRLVATKALFKIQGTPFFANRKTKKLGTPSCRDILEL